MSLLSLQSLSLHPQLRINGRTNSMEMFRLLKSYLPSENLPYAIIAVLVGMSNPSAPFSKHKKQRSRKKCPDKQITAQDLWPSIRLHGISLFIMLHGIKHQGIGPLNIKPLGIMHHGPS